MIQDWKADPADGLETEELMPKQAKSRSKSLTRKSPPSSHDVARVAKVSQAAVSRAFTPGASISEETRERIFKAAKKIGYRPNLLARSLIMGRSGIVGIVMGNPKNPSFTTALDALSTRLTKAGKHILIFTAEKDDASADVHVEDLLKYRVDALLLISALLSTTLAEHCRAAGIPVIHFNRVGQNAAGMSTVTGANREGARQVAEHLVQQGYRNLAYMANFRGSKTNRERETAFTGYVTSQGLPEPQSVLGHFHREGAMTAARDLLSQPKRPDAIFCANDYMALATIDVARFEFGLTVGKDLGVAGFDDIEQAAWPPYDLTTYSHPVDQMADKAVELLLQDVGAEEVSNVVVEGELKCRGSTRRKG
jgi:DNA-binding LacI/PurR family transcriptional regulator